MDALLKSIAVSELRNVFLLVLFIEIITISGYQFLSWPLYLHNLSIVWLHRSLMLNADFCHTLCTWTRTIKVSSTCIYSVCVRVECESYISSHVNILQVCTWLIIPFFSLSLKMLGYFLEGPHFAGQ